MATKKTGSLKGVDVVLVTSVNLAASDVTGVLPVANGGNGTGSFTDGQLLIGNTTGNTLTKTTLTGTANQVVVTNGPGSITLSLPQSIDTAAAPIFAQLIVRADGGTGITASRYSTNTGGPNFTLQKAGGTIASPLDAVAGYVAFNLLAQAYQASAFRTIANLQARCASGFGTSGTDSPGVWAFQTTPDGSATQRDVVLFDDAGNVQFVVAGTLNAAAVDVVSLVGVDRINTRHAAAANRVLAFQSERGSPIYLGDDALDFAATTGVVSVNGTDLLSMTSTAATLAGNLFLTGTLPYVDVKPSGWASSGYIQFGVSPSFAASGNYGGLYVPAGKGIAFTQAGTTLFLMDVGGNVGLGVGSTAPLAKFESRATSGAQIIASFDASNYLSTTVSSAGAVTFDATGASAGFRFSDSVGIGMAPTYLVDVLSPTLTNFGTQWVVRARGPSSCTTNGTNYMLALDIDVSNMSITAGVTDSGYRMGVRGNAITSTTGFAGTLAAQYGVFGRAGVSSATSGAIVSNAYAMYAEVLNSVAGTTITNGFGLYVTNTETTGTVANRYGVYVNTATGGKNYFSHAIGIGISSPTASLHTLASTTSMASLCLPHGSAPSAPVNGDMWTTTAGLFTRINGVTNGVGDVVGPASSVTGAASVFSGTTGKLLRASPTVTYYSVSAGAEDKIEFGATFKDFRTATDGATVTFDLDLSDQWQVTFAGNRTLAISNASIGQRITILRYQDATGNRTPTWWSNITWNNGIAPVDDPTASGWSLTELSCEGLDAYSVPKWKEISRSTSAPRTGITTATDGATVTFDLRVSPTQRVTLAGNRTLALTSGSYYVGQTFDIKLTQDATGSRTVTWWSAIKWTGGTIPTLTTTAGKSDWFRFICTDASGSPKFDILGTSMNLGA